MREEPETATQSWDDKKCIRVAPYTSTQLNLANFRRTAFGSVPETILHRLGLFDAVTKEVISNAVPYCSKCKEEVPRAHFESAFHVLLKSVAGLAGNLEGSYVAAVPGTTELPLAEHMELLESDRAIVEGRLVRREELKGDFGLPVLAVASIPESLRDTIQRWLQSGGHAIKVFHFPTRTSEGIELQQFSNEMRCNKCGETHCEVTLQGVVDLPQCFRCKGFGWFASKDRYDTEILHACLDCNGVGALSPFFEYRFCSVPLRNILTLSFKDLCTSFLSEESQSVIERNSSWLEVIKEVSSSPLGEYPCGTPIQLLSYDERVVLTALQCLSVRYGGPSLLFDLETLSSSSVTVKNFLIKSVLPRISAQIKCSNTPSTYDQSVRFRDVPHLHISDVVERGIKVDHFSFPQGQNTFIWGDIEGAQVKLLEIVNNRFLKRKKFFQTCNFEGCSDLRYVSQNRTPSLLFAELIGVDEKLADLFSSTAAAQRAGLGRNDFKVIRSLPDCPTCGGEREEECPSCRGELYDWRLSTVRIGSVSFQDAVQLPLKTMVDSVLLDDSTDYVIREVAKWIPESTTLATTVSSVQPSLSSYLFTLSRLLEPFSGLQIGKGKKRSPLILIDNPFSGVGDLDAEIRKAMSRLCDLGATILSAGGELRYPKHFAKVVSFKKSQIQSTSTPYFHERYLLNWEPFEYRSVSG